MALEKFENPFQMMQNSISQKKDNIIVSAGSAGRVPVFLQSAAAYFNLSGQKKHYHKSRSCFVFGGGGGGGAFCTFFSDFVNYLKPIVI